MKAATVVLSLLVLSTPAGAQRLLEARSAAAPTVTADRVEAARASVGRVSDGRAGTTATMVATGTLFAAGGIFGGAMVGAGMACGNTDMDDWCGIGGALIGAMVGEMIMLPWGVHIASSRSSYGKKLWVSTGVMLAGVVLAPATAGISLLAAPPLQLMAAIGVEQNAQKGAR